MKLFFSPKTKLIKLAEEERSCRLCSTPSQKNVGSLPVIPYSLFGETTKVNKFRSEEAPGCTDCNSTGKVTVGNPSYRECPTCKEGASTIRGIGQGPGVYRPHKCETCRGSGEVLAPDYRGAEDDLARISCPTCKGDSNNIPSKICPTCKESDRPGFVQTGESKHDVVCPTCKGSKKHTIVTHYTPILQVKCPHLEGKDTFTKPKVEGANDELGPYDNNYFEGRRLIPLRLFGQIRGLGDKYKRETTKGLPSFKDTGPEYPDREVGMLTPALPPVRNGGKELSYLDLFSKPELLNPDNQRISSSIFKNAKKYFNSKTAKPNNVEEPANPSNEANSNELGDDFFGGIKETQKTTSEESTDFEDLFPGGLSINTVTTPSRGSLTPEQSRRLHGGPVTVRQMDESDMLRPFLKNPSKSIEKTKSMLRGQRSLSEKRDYMSKMFKGMKDLERKTKVKDGEPDERRVAKEKRLGLGLRPSYRGWRDNLHDVSVNLDMFGQLRGALRKQLSSVIGKRMDPQIATALTTQAFRGETLKTKDGKVVDLTKHRLGIVEPMPYFKNDENWREMHSGLGCDHDPKGGHEPDVGCMVDFHNPSDNPKEGVTTGVNSRLVTGKYTRPDGKTVLQTVGARLKRTTESGLSKQDLRSGIPQWTPENHGRIVELPADRATCVPNRIQREHYVVNHTIEPPTEKSEYTSLPPEETGIKGLSPEPLLAKEKIKFPEEIRQGGPTESVYVGNPLYQLSNPFSTQEVERGMWANNPIVQHFAKQIKDGKRPEKFKPYVPEPKFNSQKMKDRPGLTGPPPAGTSGSDIIFDFADNDDFDSMFGPQSGETPPKTSKKEDYSENPVEENADDTYDYSKKLKVQKMQRTQVHMTQPTNPSVPDITPAVPEINYK